MKFFDWSEIINKNAPSIDFAPDASPLRRTVWLIFSAAMVIMLAFLGSSTISGSEEDVAEGIRELLAGVDIFSGDAWWIRGDHSPLWFCRLRMLPGMLAGNSELTCRLLTVIFALFLLGGVMSLAEELFDRQVMCCAAWMLIGSCGFIIWSRSACSFIILCAWVVWSAVLIRGEEKLFLRQWLFFILFFSGAAWWGMNYLLTLPAVAVIALNKKWLKFNWLIFPAMLAALIPVTLFLLWSVGSPSLPLMEYPGRLWQQLSNSFIESWRIAVWHGGEINPKMFLNLPRMLFPWTLPVFCALACMAWQWRELDNVNRRLLGGTLLLILLIGVFPARRWPWQLSILPFMLIICSSWLCGSAGGEKVQDFVNTVMKWILSLGCSFAASVILMFPVWKMFFSVPMSWGIMFGVPLLGLCGLAFMIFDTGAASDVEKVSGMNGSWSGYILAGVCFSAALFSVAAPELKSYHDGKDFWRNCGRQFAQLPEEEVLFFNKQPNAKAIYYMALKRRAAVVSSQSQLTGALKKISTGEAMVVLELKDRELLKNMLANAGWEFTARLPLASEYGITADSAMLQEDELQQNILCQIKRLR
ncbi:MAG: glycosyltransferase family 39 protein [Lentisphaeria bacterium]|nr:glycosyltransferase family 39 protein [Lentisphaeria bacterium]